MTKYNVFLEKRAVKSFKTLDLSLRKRFKQSLRELSKDPFHKRPKADIKKLEVYKNPELYRLRIGAYRAYYFVINKDIKITQIVHRSKAYK